MKGKANGIKEPKTKFLDEKRSRQGFYNHLHKKRNLNRKEVVESWSAAEGCCIFRSLSAAAVSLPRRTRARNKSEYLHRLHEDGHPRSMCPALILIVLDAMVPTTLSPLVSVNHDQDKRRWWRW